MIRRIFFIVLFLFIAVNAFGATQLYKTVEEDGNGDYTSLEACMNGNEQDLVSNDKYFDVAICGTDLGGGGWGSADATAVTIENYTTDATRYINIYTTATARHQGIYSTSYYLLSTNTSANLLILASNYVYITGLQFKNTNTALYIRTIHINASVGYHYISKNIIQGLHDNVSYESGIHCDDGTSTLGEIYVWNNIITNISHETGAGSAGIYFCGANSAKTFYAYSNTVLHCAVGIRLYPGYTDTTVKNNICYNNLTDYIGTFNAASDYNFSKDDTAPEAAGNSIWGDTDGKTPDFVDTTEGAEDLHLQSTSDAIDEGINTSGEGAPLNFTDDIDGDTRSGTWDMGADEYVSAPPSVVFIGHLINTLEYGGISR